MPACKISPPDRREQVRRVGNDLVKNFGRKKFYTVAEVKAANRRQAVATDYSCWSFAAFNSRDDFMEYHRSLGETCDYAAMKSEMLGTVSTAGDTSWFNFDLSWLEFPSIDFSAFDFFDT